MVTIKLSENTYHKFFQIRNGFHKLPRPFPECLLIDTSSHGTMDAFCTIQFLKHQCPKEIIGLAPSRKEAM